MNPVLAVAAIVFCVMARAASTIPDSDSAEGYLVVALVLTALAVIVGR